MAPSKAPSSWRDEESSSDEESVAAAPVARRGKFDDEEEDSDVLDSWEAAEDSEVEREKAKKAAEEKQKAEAAAKAAHKSKTQRIEEKREANRLRRLQEEEGVSSEEEEDESEKRSRLRESEKDSDLRHAEDLFGGVGGLSDNRTARPVTVLSGDDPTSAIELSGLKLFMPNTLSQFVKLRETLVPLITANSKKPQYASFAQEFAKQLVKELNSEQIKKLAGTLNTLSNEKMKEEKAADKTGKKTKAAKTKATLSAGRNVAERADTTLYDDGLAEQVSTVPLTTVHMLTLRSDDFM